MLFVVVRFLPSIKKAIHQATESCNSLINLANEMSFCWQNYARCLIEEISTFGLYVNKCTIQAEKCFAKVQQDAVAQEKDHYVISQDFI